MEFRSFTIKIAAIQLNALLVKHQNKGLHQTDISRTHNNIINAKKTCFFTDTPMQICLHVFKFRHQVLLFGFHLKRWRYMEWKVQVFNSKWSVELDRIQFSFLSNQGRNAVIDYSLQKKLLKTIFAQTCLFLSDILVKI